LLRWLNWFLNAFWGFYL